MKGFVIRTIFVHDISIVTIIVPVILFIKCLKGNYLSINHWRDEI